MKEKNIIAEKSFVFAKRIIKMYKHLSKEKKEFTLSKQILRSGTSVGANIEEAIGGISKKDFIAKLQIAYKEIRETHYWLRLLHDTNYIDSKSYASIIKDCEELLKIVVSILKTSKEK